MNCPVIRGNDAVYKCIINKLLMLNGIIMAVINNIFLIFSLYFKQKLKYNEIQRQKTELQY